MNFSVTTAAEVPYAYTIKTIGSIPPTEETYAKFFNKVVAHRLKLEYKISELDSKGRLHYHGIILIPKSYFRKRLCILGMHLKLEQLYNREGWIKYIEKDLDSGETESRESMYQEHLESQIKLKKPLFRPLTIG